MRISDWSSDVCSSDLQHRRRGMAGQRQSGKASVPSSQFRRPILSVGAMSLLSKPKIAVDRRALLIGGGVGAGLLLAWSVWPREQSMNLAVREIGRAHV